jgi:hypothetical protein
VAGFLLVVPERARSNAYRAAKVPTRAPTTATSVVT